MIFMDEDYSFTIINDKGVEVRCDVLSVVPYENKVYLVYTDYYVNEDNSLNIIVSEIVSHNNEYELKKIDSSDTIKNVMKLYYKATKGE